MAEKNQVDWLDKWNWLFNPSLIIAVLAIGVALWQWRVTHGEIRALRDDAAQRITAINTLAQQAQLASQQAQYAAQQNSLRVADLQTRLAESQSQQQALVDMYHNMSANRDEWTLADVDQLLLTANQQLQLDGNVKAALIALQDADARLQAMHRFQFIPLRRALNSDIQHLQSVPEVDMVGVSLQVDNLIASVDLLPLESDLVHPVHHVAPAILNNVPVHSAHAFALRLWQQMQALVQVRRLDTPEAALLAPEQSYFLRQNLKLRLLSARIALSARDQASFTIDLRAAKGWIMTYFDRHDVMTRKALAQIDALLNNPINVPLPNIDASMAALKVSHLSIAP